MSEQANKPIFEKFPKPRTYPSKWDTTMMSASKEAASPADENEYHNMEKFPRPRTMPDKWSGTGTRE